MLLLAGAGLFAAFGIGASYAVVAGFYGLSLLLTFGAALVLEEAIRLMGYHQLGKELSGNDIGEIAAFLHSLTGRINKSYIAEAEPLPSGEPSGVVRNNILSSFVEQGDPVTAATSPFDNLAEAGFSKQDIPLVEKLIAYLPKPQPEVLPPYR